MASMTSIASQECDVGKYFEEQPYHSSVLFLHFHILLGVYLSVSIWKAGMFCTDLYKFTGLQVIDFWLFVLPTVTNSLQNPQVGVGPI